MNKGNHRRINTVNVLISLFLAFLAWFYVAYSVNPLTTKVYRDIPIAFTGEYELGMKGLGVEYSSSESTNVRVKLNRTAISGMNASRISASVNVADLSEGSSKVDVKVSVPDGMSVKSQTVGSVQVEVCQSSNIDVETTVGYDEPSESKTEPVVMSAAAEKVSVMGAKSLIEKVKYVLYPVNESLIDEDGTLFNVKPVAIDEDGEIIKHVVIMPSTVSVKAYKGAVRTVKLNIDVKNENGSEVGRTFTVPPTVTIKGPKEVVDKIAAIDAKSVDLSDVKKSQSIPIEYELPEGVYVANSSFMAAIKVKVK